MTQRTRHLTSQDAVDRQRGELIPPVRIYLSGADAVATGSNTSYTVGSGTTNQIFREPRPFGQWGTLAPGALVLTIPWTGFYRVSGECLVTSGSAYTGFIIVAVGGQQMGRVVATSSAQHQMDVTFSRVIHRTAGTSIGMVLNYNLSASTNVSIAKMEIEYLG